MIGGLALAAITQAFSKEANCRDEAKWLFWISSSICLTASMHCLLTTTLANIFGVGLGLRGPAG